MRKFVRESWLILALGLVFATLLACAQTAFQPRIQDNQARALNEAIGLVVPGTVRTERVRVEGYDRDVFRCLAEGQTVAGWAVEAVGTGFADRIRLVVGLSPDARSITGLKVIENVETPGLGNKIAEEAWAAQYRGLDAGRPIVVRKRPPAPDRNEVQAVTGATISSTAVTEIVNRALERVRPGLERL